jgi:acyl carrier protein
MESLHSDAGIRTMDEWTREGSSYEEPRGKLEQAVAQLWAETFRLDRAGRHANFFELGGDSLIGMELMEKASSRFGLELPVVLLFQNPTPQRMAALIETLDQPEDSDIPAAAHRYVREE